MKIDKTSVISLLTFLFTLSPLITNISYADKTYSIGVQDFADFHPYSAIKDNDYHGFNRELLDMFATSQNFKFEYKIRPIKRLYAEFLNEKFDFKYPDNANWVTGVKKKVHYSNAVVSYTDGLIVRKENKGRALSELKKISLINGFTLEKQYRLAHQQGTLEFVRTNHYQRLLDLVTEQRVDGAYFDTKISAHHIADSQGKNSALVFDDGLPYIHGSRRLSSIKHPKLIILFNEFLISHKTKIDQLKSKHHINNGEVEAHSH